MKRGHTGRRCAAPLDPEGRALCGKPAVTTRVVEDFEINLCAGHAHELDEDREHEAHEAN